MSLKNKEVVEKVNAAFARSDIEAFLAFCADDFVWTMVGEKIVQGKDGIREWMGSGPAEPPTFSVDAVVGEGDFVSAFGDMTMKEKDGSVGSYSYSDVYRFRGDKIAELKAFVIRTDRPAVQVDPARAKDRIEPAR